MLAQSLKDLGVVGAGGAGFPTYVKADSKVEFVLANGAECEPLLHKDFELMHHFPEPIVEGMSLMMKATGAPQGKFGIKEKNKEAIASIEPLARAKGIDMVYLGDFYPSGDEYELVYEATGRLIPAAGIPLQVGCVVNNVETLYNVFEATQGKPVTRKFVSINGAVRDPKSFWVPLGTSYRDLLQLAGGATVDQFAMFVGGLMMGSFTYDLDQVVTKTTGGLIVLPQDHYLVKRKDQPLESMNRIGKSACDQCSYCTEFCPRYLLGYEVMPHKVMRSLGFTTTGSDIWNQWSELCCSCGLCTLYACPEDLYPREACDQGKVDMRAAGLKFVQQKPVRVHPMKNARRVPLHMLRKRLKVEEYERETPYDALTHKPDRVRLMFKQHAGKPATPVVKVGDKVKVGAVVAAMGDKDLGANVHASIKGTVDAVTEQYIEVRA